MHILGLVSIVILSLHGVQKVSQLVGIDVMPPLNSTNRSIHLSFSQLLSHTLQIGQIPSASVFFLLFTIIQEITTNTDILPCFGPLLWFNDT